MIRLIPMSFVPILFVVLAPTAEAQMVEAPVYRSWAQYPVGTTLTQKTVLKGNDGSVQESKTVQKLISKDDTLAVVEQTHFDPDGEESTQTFRHRAQVAMPSGIKPEELGRPRDPKGKGEETLEIGGKTLEATWYDTTGQAEAGTMLIRTWFSSEVPGTIVKVLTRIDGYDSSTTIELVELKIP